MNRLVDDGTRELGSRLDQWTVERFVRTDTPGDIRYLDGGVPLKQLLYL